VDNAFSISIDTLREDVREGKIIMLEDDTLLLKSNTQFSIKIKSNHYPPRPIPEGYVFIYLEKEHPSERHQPVVLCERHQMRLGEQLCTNVLRSTARDMLQCMYNATQPMLCWAIDGSPSPVYSSYIEFGCYTSDFSKRKTCQFWTLKVMGGDGYSRDNVIPEMKRLKVKQSLHPEVRTSIAHASVPAPTPLPSNAASPSADSSITFNCQLAQISTDLRNLDRKVQESYDYFKSIVFATHYPQQQQLPMNVFPKTYQIHSHH